MNTQNFQNGCPGAVWQNGNPSREYCENDSGLYSWWQTCCVWNGAKYVPKGTKGSTHEHLSIIHILSKIREKLSFISKMYYE